MKWITTHINNGKQFLLLFVLFFVPAIGMGQQPTLEGILKQAGAAGIEQSLLDNLQNHLGGRVSEEELIAILEPAVALAGQNLPSEMIFRKAMEGLSKGVPVQQMRPVLQNIQQSLESVVPVVDSWLEREEVNEMLATSGERFNRVLFRIEMLKVSARAAVQQGGLELVRDILNNLSDAGVLPTVTPSRILAAVNIIVDLPEVAERPDAALGIVVKAVQSNFSAAEIQTLPGAMNVALRRSQLPAAAVLEGVSQQLGGDIPASRVLQDLFDGNIGHGHPGSKPPGLEDRPGRGGQPGNGHGG